ncbi:hypothetical protein JXB41_03990 [Candidatus Woesearchaeota archaeon]|nr:hypothetical protein [Candidatus Woesearchaeota archaeon]
MNKKLITVCASFVIFSIVLSLIFVNTKSAEPDNPEEKTNLLTEDKEIIKDDNNINLNKEAVEFEEEDANQYSTNPESYMSSWAPLDTEEYQESFLPIIQKGEDKINYLLEQRQKASDSLIEEIELRINELRIAVEVLNKFQVDSNYIDKDNDGSLSYSEFLNEPFEVNQAIYSISRTEFIGEEDPSYDVEESDLDVDEDDLGIQEITGQARAVYVDKDESTTEKKSISSKLADCVEEHPERPIIATIYEEGIYNGIKEQYTILKEDLEKQGYCVVSYKSLNGYTIETIKDGMLKVQYDNYGERFKGAILIGNLPSAWFEAQCPREGELHTDLFPTDLYFMDLDGEWDGDCAGVIDGCDGSKERPFKDHKGNTDPEIFVGRIIPSPGTKKITLINAYLDRVHKYKTQQLSLAQRAVVFIDDTWGDFSSLDIGIEETDKFILDLITGVTAQVGKLYTPVHSHHDDANTKKEHFVEKLIQDYEFIYLRIHSSNFAHTICNEHHYEKNEFEEEEFVCDIEEIFSIPDIITPDIDDETKKVKKMFYDLHACSSSLYIKENLASTYVFQTPYGLLAIGNTKPGSREFEELFYGPLNNGASFGGALVEWFKNYKSKVPNEWEWTENDMICYNYGHNIIGDPTLKPSKRMEWISESDDDDDNGGGGTGCSMFTNPNGPFDGGFQVFMLVLLLCLLFRKTMKYLKPNKNPKLN